MLKGFKEFLFKGNIVDLAVAVVIGGAFGSVVTALVKDIVTPVIAAVGGQPDFSQLFFTINNSKFMIGDFLNAVVSFVIVGAVIYFGVILPMNKLLDRMRQGKTVDPTEKTCPECLSFIPIKARRCKFCTAVIGK